MATVSTAEPYTDVASHLRDELRRAWLRIEYQIRLAWSKSRAPVAPSDDLVGPTEIGRLFAAARGEHGGSPSDDAGAAQILDQWLAAFRGTEARIRATIDRGISSPLVDLIRAFGLTPRQWTTLMFALLPETDPNLVQAYRYLARDDHARGLDGRLLAMLVYDTPTSRSLMARDLSPSSPLLRYRLVDLVAGTAAGDSTMFRRIRPATRLVYLLDGTHIDLDPELAEICELREGDARGEFPELTLQHARAALRSSEVVLAVQGQRGLGKKLLLQIAAAHWQQRLLLLDGKRLAQIPVVSQHNVLRSIVRELLLLNAIPVFHDLDDVVTNEGDRDELPGFFAALLDEWHGPLALTINRERMPRIHQRPLVHLTVEVPSLQLRTRMWRDVVPPLGEAEAESLSGRFAIPGGIVVAAAHAAEAGRMPDAGPPEVEDLAKAVAAQLQQRISRLGKRLQTPFDLDDLIVDEDTRGAIM
jgi:hypothetical protein